MDYQTAGQRILKRKKEHWKAAKPELTLREAGESLLVSVSCLRASMVEFLRRTSSWLEKSQFCEVAASRWSTVVSQSARGRQQWGSVSDSKGPLWVNKGFKILKESVSKCRWMYNKSKPNNNNIRNWIINSIKNIEYEYRISASEGVKVKWTMH